MFPDCQLVLHFGHEHLSDSISRHAVDLSHVDVARNDLCTAGILYAGTSEDLW